MSSTRVFLDLAIATGVPAGSDEFHEVIGPFDDVESARRHQAAYGPAAACITECPDAPARAVEWSTPAQHPLRQQVGEKGVQVSAPCA